MPLPNSLPLVLAGPILRRVDPGQVTVWMALSQPCSAELGVWAGLVDTDIGVVEEPFQFPGVIHISTPANSIPIGANLHLVLVNLKMLDGEGLTPGQLFSYNVVLTDPNGNKHDLRSLGFLKNKTDAPKHVALGFNDLFLPSFAMAPAALDQLNIVHGSCRKAHGHGVDALAALDNLIKKAGSDPLKRPHQLFMTGDQIYADEVGRPLLPMLNEAGQALLGITENLKVEGADIPATIQNFPAGRRQKLCNETAKFTSGAANSHILSFGEFCAMYLFYWSTCLWSALPEGENALDDAFDAFIADQNPAPQREDLLSDFPEATDTEKLGNLKKAYITEVANLKTFLGTLPNAMRVLANVPTYMVFDDHEVTDDWNITRKWRQEVHAASLGQNIVRNGLSTYVLFQDWGNVPDRYQSGDYAQALTEIQGLFPSGAPNGPVDVAAGNLDNLFAINQQTATFRWDYVVPTGPTHTLVLDTRTRRTFDKDYSPPGLMTDIAMDEQLPPSLAPNAGAEVLLVVSPVPALGLALMEEMIQPIATATIDAIHAMGNIAKHKKTKLQGHFKNDLEAWGFNPPVFEKLLEHLFPYKKVVILSGDVHYGFSTALDYWKKDDPEPARIVQVTASPFRNQEEGWMRFPVSSGLAQLLFGRSFIPVERMAWASATSLIGEVNTPNGGLIPPVRAQMQLNPVLLHPEWLPEGTTINIPTDWAWRLHTLADVRPDDTSSGARPKDGQAKAIGNDVDPAQPGTGYTQVMIRQDDSLRKNIVRRMVWYTHLGWVSFSGTGDTLKVRHEIRYTHPGGAKPNDPDAYTVHEASLSPTTDPQPSLGAAT